MSAGHVPLDRRELVEVSLLGHACSVTPATGRVYNQQGVCQATVDGQQFVIRARPDQPGVYDFDWLTGLRGYGFTSACSDGSAMSRAEMEDAIRNFLAQVDQDTDFIP